MTEKRTYSTAAEAAAVANEAAWLAYQASKPMGMGWLHWREDATRDEVLSAGQGRVWDYVLGRMVKLRMRIHGARIEVTDPGGPHPDYQSWCGRYPTYAKLFEAAEGNLGIQTAE